MGCEFTSIQMGNERVLKFKCADCQRGASIEQSEACMHEVVLRLTEDPEVDAVILTDVYEREYRGSSLEALKELARAYEKCRYWPFKHLVTDECKRCEAGRRRMIGRITEGLPRHPSQARSKLIQSLAEVKAQLERGAKRCRECRKLFIERSLEPILEALKRVKLVGDGRRGREEYAKLLRPLIRPRFSPSRVLMEPPPEAELVDAYSIGDNEVRIYHLPSVLQHFYFLIPLEHRLSPEHVALLTQVREKLLNRHSLGVDFSDPLRAREQVKRSASRLMTELVIERRLDITKEEVEMLASCLAKFSSGLGVLETLLSDPKVQDIYIDAPIGRSPVHLYHSDHEECLTNIYLAPEDAESLASRFRAISGRPFSEADPVLDLNLPEFGTRVAAICRPLSHEGMALALRRHKPTPWTLPQFVKNRFLSAEAAGLLSLLVDSQASILIAGSRAAGKTSLLGSLMFEILQKLRIICIEDTLELPIAKLRALGFKIQSLHVQSAVAGSGAELRAEDALRAALRLGESVLVIGEVRGSEAKTLYEAMRVGAAGNSVLGTIHGATSRDVFDRVVYDLGIPPSSFKATDVIVVAAPIRLGGGIKRIRRVVQISEVGKDWKVDPISEEGLLDLMTYDQGHDELRRTKRMKSSKLIAAVARKWGTKPADVICNLKLRAHVLEALVSKSNELNMPALLEAEFVVRSNNALRRLLEERLRLYKSVDYRWILKRWLEWLENATPRT
jgi:type IV secretory pathway ATPase VirB11/archaellum biosynthesis ATPase